MTPKNGSGKLMYWLMAIMATAVFSLIGAAYADIKSDIRLQRAERKEFEIHLIEKLDKLSHRSIQSATQIEGLIKRTDELKQEVKEIRNK